MSEEENWSAYRKELDPKIDSTSPFIPFLGVFLTDVALSQEAFSLAKRTRMKRSTYSEKGQGLNAKRSSNNLYETYTILEPITIRNRLEKLRNSSREKESGNKPLLIHFSVSIFHWPTAFKTCDLPTEGAEAHSEPVFIFWSLSLHARVSHV